MGKEEGDEIEANETVAEELALSNAPKNCRGYKIGLLFIVNRKKKLKTIYKETLQPMGVFQIRNLANDKVFVSSSKNLEGIFNRYKFQLKMGGHPNKDLQKDWNEFGSENFAFEILEELFPRENPDYDYRDDLTFLEDLWLEQLKPYGEKGYNERKKTREERLRMIAANKKFN